MQPQKNLLRQVFLSVAFAGKTGQGAENPVLVLFDNGGEIFQASQTPVGQICFTRETIFASPGLIGRKETRMQSFGLPEMMVLTIVFLLIPLAALIMIYLVRSLQTKERLRAIEKGVSLPANGLDPWERAASIRHSGILSLAAGLGITALFIGIQMVSQVRAMTVLGLGVGAIPMLVGCGQLLEYWLRVRELRARRGA